MKKALTIFNYVLIIIAIIISYYLVITRDKEIGLILKDASIIVTITVPYIIEKLFKKNISLGIKTVYVIFIFLAQFLGVTLEWYNSISYFDKFTHWLSGILTAFLSITLLNYLKIYDYKKIVFNIIWMISITLAIACLWEIFEYLANIVFGGDAQRVAATGVNDTMQDIIVAFLGSIIVSILYLWEYLNQKDGIINNFAK